MSDETKDGTTGIQPPSPEPAQTADTPAEAVIKQPVQGGTYAHESKPQARPGKVRLRWHGVPPALIILPIVALMIAATILVIYFTTRQEGARARRTSLFLEGLLPVAVTVEEADGTSSVKWGYIDKSGEFIIEAQFLSAEEFAPNGLAAVETEKGWGYIGKSGDFVITPQFEGASAFSYTGSAAVKRNGSWGYIERDGKFFINPQFDEAYPFGDEGLALVMIGGKYGYINEAGAYVIVPRFEDAESFRADGNALVFEFDKWGMINSKGEYVFNPQFDTISEFADNGLALVSKDGKYGFINKKGVYVIEPTYDHAEEFASNGLALVCNEGVWGFVDKAGTLVLTGYAKAYSFGTNGLAPVQATEDGTWQFINHEGKPASETTFAAAQTHFYGFALTMDEENVLTFVDEKEKKSIVCPEDTLTAIGFFEDGFAILIRREEGVLEPYYTLINNKGEVVLARAEAIYLGPGISK